MKIKLEDVSSIFKEYIDTKVKSQYLPLGGYQYYKNGFLLDLAKIGLDNLFKNPAINAMVPEDGLELEQIIEIAKNNLTPIGGKFYIPVLNFSISDVEIEDIYEIAKKYAKE